MNGAKVDLAKFRTKKRRVDENGVEWMYSDAGAKWVEVGTVPEAKPPKKAKRKSFQVEWIQFPLAWRDALRRAKSAGTTYDLAFTILVEAFKCEWVGGEIVLSAETTKMTRCVRRRAAKELVELGLIWKGGNSAFRVSIIT